MRFLAKLQPSAGRMAITTGRAGQLGVIGRQSSVVADLTLQVLERSEPFPKVVYLHLVVVLALDNRIALPQTVEDAVAGVAVGRDRCAGLINVVSIIAPNGTG